MRTDAGGRWWQSNGRYKCHEPNRKAHKAIERRDHLPRPCDRLAALPVTRSARGSHGPVCRFFLVLYCARREAGPTYTESACICETPLSLAWACALFAVCCSKAEPYRKL